MEVRNCRHCGRLFNYIGGQIICPACKEELEVKFQEVKKYVYEHKGVGVTAVSEACDVEASQIRQWIREERLEFATGTSEISCEKCGTPISSGRFCEKCKMSMVNSLNSAYSSPVQHPSQKNNDAGPRMRFT